MFTNIMNVNYCRFLHVAMTLCIANEQQEKESAQHIQCLFKLSGCLSLFLSINNAFYNK